MLRDELFEILERHQKRVGKGSYDLLLMLIWMLCDVAKTKKNRLYWFDVIQGGDTLKIYEDLISFFQKSAEKDKNGDMAFYTKRLRSTCKINYRKISIEPSQEYRRVVRQMRKVVEMDG